MILLLIISIGISILSSGQKDLSIIMSSISTIINLIFCTALFEHVIAKPIENVAKQALDIARDQCNSINHLNRID